MASKALVIYIYNPLFVMEHFQFSFFKKIDFRIILLILHIFLIFNYCDVVGWSRDRKFAATFKLILLP